jgi:esterase FrsA
MKIFKTIAVYAKNHILLSLLVLIITVITVYFSSPFDGLTISQKWIQTKSTISVISQIMGEDETKAIDDNILPGLGDLEKQAEEGVVNLFRDVRAGNWAFLGADRQVMADTMQRILNNPNNKNQTFIDTFPGDSTGPGTWTFEWAQTARHFYETAELAEKEGIFEKAKNNYYLASVYFNISKFPYLGYPEEDESHRRATESYEKAGRYFEVPLEKIVIPFEGGDIVGYLHLPRKSNHQKVPMVIWTGGLDYFKEWMYPNAQAMHERGIALITLDTAGLGDSDEWLLTPENSRRIIIRMIDELTQHPKIDAERIGIAGTSMGGNIALQVVFTDERIKAAVNHCGPVHRMWTVNPNIYGIIKEMVKHTFSDRTGADVTKVSDFAAKARPFDLVAAGFVGQNKYTTDIPILSVNGGNDFLAPVSDMELVTNASRYGEHWVMGQNESHCAHAYEPIMIPQIADWLATKLSSKKDLRSAQK